MHTFCARYLLIALASVLSWLPGTHAAHAQASQSRSADTAGVVIRIRVVDSLSDAPIEARVEAFADSGPAAVSYGITAADGMVELRVPKGRVELRVRRIGFRAQRTTIDATTRASHAVAHEFRLERASLSDYEREEPDVERRLQPIGRPSVDSIRVTRRIRVDDHPSGAPSRDQVDSIRAELRKRTAVTPCRPLAGSAFRIWERVRNAVLVDFFSRQDLPDLRFASVEHVVDRARCHAAIAAIGRHHGSPRDSMQVHLFQLDYAGWAAVDPSPLGDVTVIYVFDWNLTRVRRVLGVRGR